MDTISKVLRTMETHGINFDWTACLNSVVKEEVIKFRQCKASLGKSLKVTFPTNNRVDILGCCKKAGFNMKSTALPYLKSHRCDGDSYEYLYQLMKSGQQIDRYKDIRDSIVDGKIYSHWYDNGTKTGRITSRDFNVQGLPKVCRPFVVADEGCKIVTADYSNIELRLLADFSGDVNLLNAFEHGEDVHKLTASKVFEKPPSEVTDIERGVAKKINFGVVYGVTSIGLQRMLKDDLKLETTQEQAQGYIDSFYCAYPHLRPYFQEVLSAEEYKHIENPRSRINYPIQHGCAVGFKGSIVRLYESMPKTWRIICLLHDEIALQVLSSDVEQARTLLEQSMVEGMKTVSPNVNISVDIAVDDSWIKC